MWVLVLLADFVLEFRFEYLWPFWLFIRSVYDSFRYQGLVRACVSDTDLRWLTVWRMCRSQSVCIHDKNYCVANNPATWRFRSAGIYCVHSSVSMHSNEVLRLFLLSSRRSPCSSSVWRLHQTSSASSSFLSSGCFLLPAPMYGSSMCGTQVSPSFVWILFLTSASRAVHLLSLHKQLPVVSVKPGSVILFLSQIEGSVCQLYHSGSCLCTSKLPYGSKIWRTFM